MKRYEYDENTCNGWKSYPIRLTVNTLSKCHSKPQVLVQSMEGGFVRINCLKCGQYENLTESVFKGLPIIVSCPQCKETMAPRIIEKNY